MSEFEKAELLRERANVSFEEAREALRACNGKLVEALEYIESKKAGKAAERVETTYTRETVSYTSRPGYTHSEEYDRVYNETIRKNTSSGSGFWDFLRSAIRKSVETEIVVSKDGIEKFRTPVIVLIILFCIFHAALLIAMGVSLFFGVTYNVVGKGDLSGVNRTLNEVSSSASRWWENSHISNEAKDLCRKYDAMDEINR